MDVLHLLKPKYRVFQNNQFDLKKSLDQDGQGKSVTS